MLRDARRDLRGRAWLPGGLAGAAEDAGGGADVDVEGDAVVGVAVFRVSEGLRCRMPQLGGSGLVRCVFPRTCVGALGIGEDAGLYWLREVQGG